MGHALEVFAGGVLVLSSDGKWLHPLFELERFLVGSGCEPHGLVVFDKVVGRAAALGLVHLGVGSIRAGVMSHGGRAVLEHHRVPYSYQELVERIGCQTEDLLAVELDPERAWRLIRSRSIAPTSS
jgi:hypothetical protein